MIFLGTPCNKIGKYLPSYTCPPSTTTAANADDTNPWNPFNSQVEFDFVHYHFVEVQNFARKIDQVLDLWAACVMEFSGDAPWENSDALYATIDAIKDGDSPWKVYSVHYKSPHPPSTPPKWMTETYELCMRDS